MGRAERRTIGERGEGAGIVDAVCSRRRDRGPGLRLAIEQNPARCAVTVGNEIIANDVGAANSSKIRFRNGIGSINLFEFLSGKQRCRAERRGGHYRRRGLQQTAVIFAPDH